MVSRRTIRNGMIGAVVGSVLGFVPLVLLVAPVIGGAGVLTVVLDPLIWPSLLVSLQAGIIAGVGVAVLANHYHTQAAEGRVDWRPTRVAELVLSGASADYQGVLGVTTWVTELLNRIRAAIERADRRFRDGVEADLEDESLPPDIVAAIVDGRILLAGYEQSAMALAGVDFPTKLRTFDGPVLLLHGAEDRLNPDAAETPAPSLPVAKTRVIPNAGHTCSIERPDEYTSIVREFATENVWNSDAKQEDRL